MALGNCINLLYISATANLSVLVLRRSQTIHKWKFLYCVTDTVVVLKCTYGRHLNQVNPIRLGYGSDDLVLLCILAALTEDIVLCLVWEMDASTFRRGACWRDGKWEIVMVTDYWDVTVSGREKRNSVWVSELSVGEQKQSWSAC